MDALLRNLENESLLLMYLAGELPDEDRREIDSLLATDGGLRAQLLDLRAASASAMGSLAQLDAAEPLRSADFSVRQVSRAMRQWQVERLVRPAPQSAKRRRMPVWSYPVATAAMVLIGLCCWWGLHPETASTTQPAGTSSDGLALDTSPSPGVGQPDDRPRLSATLVTLDSTSQGLADLERAVSDDLQ